MKLRNLSLLLFVAACGGGKDPIPQPVDSPTGDGGGVFPNSRNDMVLVTFPEMGSGLSFTPDTTDVPDNDAALAITEQSGGFKVEGDSGIAGDHSDEYFERDTFLIATAAGVNQLTIRLQWDGNASDHDFFLLEEAAAGDTDPVAIASGTLISNGQDMMGAVQPEFATFVVEPSHNYWLWSGVYQENAAPGGQPSLPSPYDFSIFGEAVDPADFTGACDTTEAGEGANGTAGNNNIESFGGTGNKQTTQPISVGASGSTLICGTLNSGHFLVNPDDATVGTDDVDTYTFSQALDGDLLVTIIGETANDQTAIQGLAATGLLAVALFNEPCAPAADATKCPDVDTMTAGVQPRPQQFFTTSEVDYFRTHGVTAFRMIKSSTVNSQNMTNLTDIVGPSTLAVFMQSNAPGVLMSNIKYRLRVTADNRNTRAPRIAGAANTTESNDN